MTLHPHMMLQVWEAASQRSSKAGRDAEGGGSNNPSLARLHSALIAVLTHLVNKLRGHAMNHAAVQAVVVPLLQVG
jgi:hypothetical protein